MIGAMFKRQNIKGRPIIVDPGGGMQAFNRIFADRYKDQIVHLTHASVKSIDPFNKTIATEFDDLRFDDGIRMAAREIASRARGSVPDPLLPDSVCQVFSDVQPLESIRIDTEYRLRGDGVIAQKVRQHHDPQPRGEDAEWAKSMYADFLVGL